MNFNKFTIKAQEAVQQAQQLATSSGHQSIEPAHILKGVLEVDENVSPYLFKKVGANVQMLNLALDKMIESMPKVDGGSQYLSPKANQVLAKAEDLIKGFGDEYVSIEHILLALLDIKDQAGTLMKDSGVDQSSLKKAIEELRKGEKVTSQSAEDNYNSLNKYAVHLNEQAKNGKLDPVIGRDEEIRRVLQILSRRTKNNPILIGEPGVGKTAIAEGLAHRIVNGDVPENLKDKELYSLDMGALIAGAKYKGEFEERLKSVVKEVTGSDGKIVLFIDEIHTLVGAGKSDGAMDAANILKPALARGDLRAIGATTLSEYQKYFENDKALERRFQTVLVDEPSEEDAISILRGLKERYETHHKVRIKDEAIIGAVQLSQRYITDRFLPDKAIDLIDEAASKLRLQINSMPVELDEVQRKMRQLEIEREAIKREDDTKKLEALNRQIADLQEKRDSLKAKWEGEKEVVEGIQNEKKRLEELKLEADKAERQGDLGKVAEIRYGKVVETEAKLKDYELQWSELDTSGSRMIKEEVDAEDIAEVVAKWTGIPVQKMLQSDVEKLLHLEDELHKRVVSQEEAITAVADAVRRSRSGLQDMNRPIGSFIFMGTTGVGKTELAKALAEYLFDNENALTRIDMSEYQERHAVSRLVGAPPGYVGYEEGGQLTEAVRRKPYSVVLLDEIEKAHPDVFNILLQVLDEGRLTDNKGRVANFKNTIIIMTSNLGSDIITQNFEGVSDEMLDSVLAKTELEMKEMLRRTLKPEFLNRIDETIVFKPLNKRDVKSIVKIQLRHLFEHLKAQDIHMTATDEVIDYLSNEGFDPQFGARPIKRLIQKNVLNELSKQILSGKVKRGQDIVLDIFDGEYAFRKPIKETEKVQKD
ncbi:ATP-dependent chaperone ClpB [Salibacteraceae bacterium]|nr:ATP-dependent chaperone ClpB [Salibacteraceae bacterium]MDC1304468.1 ATP-dependent chaperone ClpB [Salibacteraceae bacterium]